MITILSPTQQTQYRTILDDDPLWYKRAVIYQLHVKAFHDSDGDGIGDFRGLIQKLDYLQELGITALWLLPFYPSPLRDDGYDIADYTAVHPAYGTLRDCKEFIVEAHRRNMRVITELVLNHTSDQHRWFQRARQSPPGSNFRDFYVWSDTDERYSSARIIFKDFESSNWAWDPVAQAYYWHRFYAHQPDLNFDNPNVQRALLRALDFWLKLGVDGLRLDAVPYLYEREGTTCENLPETHAFLKMLRRHVDANFSNRMLLAEANQWPEDAIAYFGQALATSESHHQQRLTNADGQQRAAPSDITPDLNPSNQQATTVTSTRSDECHMAFHFPLMPRLFMAIRMEDRFPIIDILQQTPPIPDDCQWAIFLRNHDELTLEMVADEERDYMYRVYAHDRQARINLGIRRRLAPLLGNNRRKIELMNGLLFSLPGTPVMYYGDEIGMGDNVYLGDRHGVRTPMQWSADRNAGFSRSNPQRLYLPVIIDPEYHFETVNVEAQHNNPHSMLWWVRRLIALRQRFPVFGQGSLTFLQPENPKVLSYLRESDDTTVLIVANLSRFVQCAEVDLSQYQGAQPVELFGGTRFPRINQLPYFFMLGPHSFYWFELEPTGRETSQVQRSYDRSSFDTEQTHPTIVIDGRWQQLFKGPSRAELERVLPQMLSGNRWFGGKAQTIARTHLLDAVLIDESPAQQAVAVVLVEIEYMDAEPETYQLPLAFAEGQEADQLIRENPHAILLQIRRPDEVNISGVVYDAVYSNHFCRSALHASLYRRRISSRSGQIVVQPTRALRKLRSSQREVLMQADPVVSEADQSNTSILYSDKAILKVFRRLDEGIHPDFEISRFLTEQAGFAFTPKMLGSIEYHATTRREGLNLPEPRTLAVLQEFVPNEGDAWQYTLDALSSFYEYVASTESAQPPELPHGLASFETDAGHDRSAETGANQAAAARNASESIGPYLHSARLLGQRTAQMHIALASSRDNPAFTPEPFGLHDARSLYQSWRNLTRHAIRTLRRQMSVVPEHLIQRANAVLNAEHAILHRFRRLMNRALTGKRIRLHGDYHLAQVLYTGKDFFIIDFEGEPGRPLTERRMKRSSLRDVSGMIRSFEYAAHTALRQYMQRWGENMVPESVQRLEQWSRFWRHWVSRTFVHAYLENAQQATFLPQTTEEIQQLLDAFLLEKAIFELAYELNHRPDWVQIPLDGILRLLEGETTA